MKTRITLLSVVGLLIAATCDEPARGGRYTYHITDSWGQQFSAAYSLSRAGRVPNGARPA